MKITLEDELGNVETVNEKLSRDYILNKGSVQDFFTICQECGRIVLYEYSRRVGGEFYCNHCKEVSDEDKVI